MLRRVVDRPRLTTLVTLAVTSVALTAVVDSPESASPEVAPAAADTAPKDPGTPIKNDKTEKSEKSAKTERSKKSHKATSKKAKKRAAAKRAAKAKAAQKRRPASRRTVSRAAVKRQERHRATPKLPLAPRNAKQTAASAESSTHNEYGMCLAWSRQQAGIPSKYSDAATAWHNAKGRHPGHKNPPRGAAVYWTGGSQGYGHIAISLGGGRVRSSDANGSGRVGTIKISDLTRDWNLKYAGWADTINGYKIPGVVKA